MDPAPPVSYRLIPVNPAAHLFEIQCRVERPNPDGQEFFLPAWIPGSYMIRDFAKHVTSFSAVSDSGPIQVEKTDKQTWRCAATREAITVTYQVYAFDLSVRGAYLDTTRGFFNGTSVFVAPKGCENQLCHVELQKPVGDAFVNWRVATAMQPASETEIHQFGDYQAADYEELIDHPVEMGVFDIAEFNVNGIPHEIVISGRHQADGERLGRDLRRICDSQQRLFTELPSFSRYVFLVNTVGDGYGGLEHRASCSLLCSRYDLPNQNMDKISEEYRQFLGLCSHEYFHAWNVKRIKPAAFMPYQLDCEIHTQQLWAFEGITSYYDDLCLLRAGLVDLNEYLELLGKTATRVWRNIGRFKQSVAESSFDAWTKFYKQDENAINAVVSYYTKGALLAITLDMRIRELTNDKKSLDDVMRHLWEEYGKQNKGVPEGEVERVASQVAGDRLGKFFQTYLYGTTELPLQESLAYIGINFCTRCSSGSDDKGGTNQEPDKQLRTSFGAQWKNDPAGIVLTSVVENGSAQRAGLSANDTIVAINELKVDSARVDKILANSLPDSELLVHAFRRDELMCFKVNLQAPPQDTIYLTVDERASNEASRHRDRWCWTDKISNP